MRKFHELQDSQLFKIFHKITDLQLSASPDISTCQNDLVLLIAILVNYVSLLQLAPVASILMYFNQYI